jgi:hypothetical protein
MAEYGEWNRKGATLSDVTARKEYGVDSDFIVKGINAGMLEYREGAIHGNPYIRVLRRQLEAYIAEELGDDYLLEWQETQRRVLWTCPSRSGGLRHGVHRCCGARLRGRRQQSTKRQLQPTLDDATSTWWRGTLAGSSDAGIGLAAVYATPRRQTGRPCRWGAAFGLERRRRASGRQLAPVARGRRPVLLRVGAAQARSHDS